MKKNLKKTNFIMCGASMLALSLSACSLKSNLDEMHDSTKDMAKTTVEMANTTTDMAKTTGGMAKTTTDMAGTTKGMAKTTEHMDETTTDMAVTTKDMSETTKGMAKTTEGLATDTKEVLATSKELAVDTKEVLNTSKGLAVDSRDMKKNTINMYTDGRQGGGVTIRHDSLAAMKAASTVESKLVQAGLYMMAMEFQLAKEEVSPQRLQHLCQEGLQEFFLTVMDFADKGMQPNPASSADKDMNLNAFVVALDQVNPNAQITADIMKRPQISMLSLIEDALRDRKTPFAALTPDEGARSEVLKNEKLAIYLLQSRANFMAAMTLSKISNINHDGFLGIPGFFTKIGMLLFKWNAILDGVNADQALEYTEFLQKSNSTRSFLTSIGEDSKIDSKLAKIYRHMQIKAPAAEPAQAAELTSAQKLTKERNAALRELVSEIDRFRAK